MNSRGIFPAKLAQGRAALLAAGLAAVLSSKANALEVKVARSVLEVPGSVQVDVLDLSDRMVQGDSNQFLKRKLVRWSEPGAQASSFILIESMGGEGSRFEWSDSCKGLQPGAAVFVHKTLHSTRDQCVLAIGPADLAAMFGRIHKAVEPDLERQGWRLQGTGYVVRSTMSIASGAHLGVVAYLPQPFAGGGWTGEAPSRDPDFPENVALWAMALNQQVQNSVLSLSGRWQLPPIKQQ